VVMALVASTKLLYVEPGYSTEMGDRSWVCNQPLWPTQPLTFSGAGNEYRPRGSSSSSVLQLGR